MNEINKLPKDIKKKIKEDLKKITQRRKNFLKFKFEKIPNIMGVLNLTPDSFSDGGKYNDKKDGLNHANSLVKSGAVIIDVGGESTRPGSRSVSKEKEWKRINGILKKLTKKNCVSLDTRKSYIMERGIKHGVKLINDISGFSYDNKTIEILKKYKISFIIHHSKGTPDKMQNNPKYKNVLFEIYDFFEKKINLIRKNGIKHNNIILDPGIGFGKNLQHNVKILSNLSIFHSLGFPLMVGISRKRFIKDLCLSNDTKKRIGGTLGASLAAILQGTQILRVHDVNEITQGIKVFKKILEIND